jgi:hypothetical protein
MEKYGVKDGDMHSLLPPVIGEGVTMAGFMQRQVHRRQIEASGTTEP